MKIHRTRLLFGVLVVSTILLAPMAISTARTAGAHAVLQSSSPADGDVLDQAPSKVSITFNEPVTLPPGALRVFDGQGERVDTGVASHGDSSDQIEVGLQSGLAGGSYAVSWRVVSADAHPVHGGFVFSIEAAGGVERLDDLLDESPQTGYEAAGATLRGLGYLGSFLVAGAAVFVAFVARRGTSSGDRGFRRMVTVAAVVAVVSQLALLPVDAALATGQGPGSLFTDGVWADMLGKWMWLTILGVAVAVVAGRVALARSGTHRRVWAVASVVAVVVAFVASGHTRTADPAWLMNLGDVVHVAAGAVWVGGLVALAWSLRARRRSDAPDEPETAAAEVAGFSRIATVSIVAVGLAGLVMAWIEVRSFRGLFSTVYGWLVVAKIGLLVVLAGLGGFNQFRLLPALRRRPDRGARWGYLRTTLRIEAIVFVAVLGVTGVLVNAQPAKGIVQMRSLVSETIPMDTGSVNLVLDPARTGPSTIHVYILDENGRPDDDPEAVAVSLVQTDLDIGPLTHDLERVGPGHYLINGSLFTMTGPWEVTFEVRVDEFTERSGSLEVDVGS